MLKGKCINCLGCNLLETDFEGTDKCENYVKGDTENE